MKGIKAPTNDKVRYVNLKETKFYFYFSYLIFYSPLKEIFIDHLKGIRQ